VIYFDPRALALEPSARAALHGKCIVVDGRTLFLSFTNFNETAHLRNIEADIVINSPHLACQLAS